MKLGIIFLAAAALGGCPRGAPTQGPDADAPSAAAQRPNNDYGDAPAECVAACANLDKLGCPDAHPEGGPGCAPVLCAVMAKFRVYPERIAVAKTKEEARAAGAGCR